MDRHRQAEAEQIVSRLFLARDDHLRLLSSSQSISNDTTHHDDPDVPTPMVMSRKASSSVDNRSNRKSMFESTTPANAPVLERVSPVDPIRTAPSSSLSPVGFHTRAQSRQPESHQQFNTIF